MALESGTYVADLNTANPSSTDPKSQGDDHLRLIKTVLQNTFAGFPGLVVITGVEAQGATASDYVVTVSPAPADYTTGFFVAFKAAHANTGAATVQVNELAPKALKAVDGSALEAGDIELGAAVVAFYDGADFFLVSGNDRAARAGDTYSGTHDFSGADQVSLPSDTSIGDVTGAELSALSGVTAGIQGQLDGKVDEVGGTAQDLTMTGTPVAPTAPAGTSTDQVATTAFVTATAFSALLPGQAGNAGRVISTDGVNAFWKAVPDFPLTSLSAR